jgi:hypothetical protein
VIFSLRGAVPSFAYLVAGYQLPVAGTQINGSLIIGEHPALRSWEPETGNWQQKRPLNMNGLFLLVNFFYAFSQPSIIRRKG